MSNPDLRKARFDLLFKEYEVQKFVIIRLFRIQNNLRISYKPSVKGL